MKKLYPNKTLRTLGDIVDRVDYITRERRNDVNDFKNLNNIFMSGRKVGKIPTGSADVSSSDRLGDFNYDANYLYLFVSGSVWRRVSLGSW